MSRIAVFGMLALAGCATPQRDITPALQGSWGGRHIGLMVGTLDTDAEFDCAEGTIYGPYLVNNGGRFSWEGTFKRGTGGPVRVGQGPPERAAKYKGVFRGGDMTLAVKLDDDTTIGPFTLERFKEPQIFRCL